MDQSAVEFQWKKHPEATQLIQAAVNKATASSAWLAQFSTNLYRHTGSRLLDWIDRIVVQEGEKELENLGFSPVLLPTEPSTSPPLWRLNQAKLPDVVSAQSLPANTPAYLAIKTESIVDLMVTHQRNDVDCPIIGQPGAPMRRVPWNFAFNKPLTAWESGVLATSSSPPKEPIGRGRTKLAEFNMLASSNSA